MGSRKKLRIYKQKNLSSIILTIILLPLAAVSTIQATQVIATIKVTDNVGNSLNAQIMEEK
jgi:hypothetical protein